MARSGDRISQINELTGSEVDFDMEWSYGQTTQEWLRFPRSKVFKFRIFSSP